MIRTDGRAFDKLRKIHVQRNYIKYPEGSCCIELGNTRVICTATVEEKVPPFLKGTGSGWVTAEYGMLPRSCPTRVPRGKDSGRTYEIQRLVGRSLRAVTDLRGFGERTIWIDCDVLQADGGTRTAAITGSFIALIDAFAAMKTSGMTRFIPVKEFVAATSVGIVGGAPVLDLCYAEDSQAEVDMNVVMTGGGSLIEVQGTGEKSVFTKAQMDDLLDLAAKGIKELVDMQRRQLKDVFEQD